MSQMPNERNNVAVPPAFRRAPLNPYSQRVQEKMQELNNNPAPTPVPTPAPAQTPTPTPVTTTPTPPVETPMSTPEHGVSTTPAQPVSTPSAPAAPSQNDQSYLIQQLMNEREQLSHQNEAMRQAIDNLSKDREELEHLKREQEIQRAVSAQAFENLGSVDPEDAQTISRAVLSAAQAPLDNLRAELEQQRKALADAQQKSAYEMHEMRRKSMNAEIMKAHPDFMQLQQTPEYRAFMSQRDGLSTKTRDQRAAEEYMAGNPAYVIDLLNQLKQNKPSVQQVMSVAPVQSAAGAVSAPTAPAAPQYTLPELNALYQMRRISHDEYREQLNKLRAANSI